MRTSTSRCAFSHASAEGEKPCLATMAEISLTRWARRGASSVASSWMRVSQRSKVTARSMEPTLSSGSRGVKAAGKKVSPELNRAGAKP